VQRSQFWLCASLLPSLVVGGCFTDPGPGSTGLPAETGDGAPGDGDPGDGDPGDGDPGDGDPGDGDPGDGDPGDGDPGDGDPGDGDPPAICGDGIVAPGELCLSETATQTPVNQPALRLAVGELDPGVMGVVVVSGTTSALSVLRGDGDGGLLDGALMDIAGSAWSVVAADIDNDGDTDVVVGGSPCSILRNDGNGGWGPVIEVVPVSLFVLGMHRIEVGQIDGNAPLDIVYPDGYNTQWIRGSANNGWSPGPAGSTGFTGGDSWIALTQLGFDGDSFTDLMVASRWEPKVVVARGMGNATFVEHGEVFICNPGACEIEELHVADLTGNGDPDIIASFATGFSVVPAKGDGTFDTFTLYASPGADHIASGDIDNDGDLDLIVTSRDDGDLRLFLNDGTGKFGEPLLFPVPGDATRSVAMADLDGDGALELITAYNYNGGGWVAVFEANP
jgi:hypothetical protein